MNRWVIHALLTVYIAMSSLAISADETRRPWRIGVVNVVSEELLRQSLRERGYIEGKNIIIESRRSQGSEQELLSLAAELVRLKVDVIVTSGSNTARAVLATTNTIPLVFSAGDPVTTRLVPNMAHPGGNATGVSAVSTELTAKRLEFLHQLAPSARRIIYLMNSSNPVAALQLEQAQKAARAFGVQLVALDVRNEAELDTALETLRRNGSDGVLVSVDLVFIANKSRIAHAARKSRLPGMSPYKEYVQAGMLASYGPDLNETPRKLATYVDKILQGAAPGDLPIEQVSKYELIINLKTAQALGITIPQSILLRADEVTR